MAAETSCTYKLIRHEHNVEPDSSAVPAGSDINHHIMPAGSADSCAWPLGDLTTACY